MSESNKVLIIRFSSFGDVTQCLSVPSRLKELGPGTEVHWATRADLAELLAHHPGIDRVWTLDRKLGFRGLWALIQALRQQHFTHVYDAHNNLRSHLICWFLRPPQMVRKSQNRLRRFLLFKLRKNFFRQPFSGQRDLLEPLKKWHLGETLPPPPQIFPSAEDHAKAAAFLQHWPPGTKPIALAPSSAYALKRWPLEYWKKLVQLLGSENFVILGGPEDHFLQEISDLDGQRILNLAGRTSFLVTAAVIKQSQILVANDTGALHLAEQLGSPVIALMGPAPFGFPSRPSTLILQRELPCRPCSKHGQGPCTNANFQECLRAISPEEVAREILRMRAQ